MSTRRLRLWAHTCCRHAFPLVTALLFVVLVGADLNGSSIGVMQAPGTHDRSLLHGHPRPIRVDEWRNTTPIQIEAVREGFPDRPYIGLTRTDQLAVLQAGPRPHALEVFKPQDWGYFALGVHRGFAYHWWFPYLVSLLGLYALSMALALGRAISASVAVVITMAPYDAWWTSPTPGSFVGLGSLSALALLLGCRARCARSAAWWGCAAGAAFVAMSLLLYPPWQIQISFVLAAIVVGHLIGHRPDPRRLLITLGAGGIVTAVVLGWWYLTCRAAIRATADTVYPGHRIGVAGAASLARLLSAPLNPPLAGTPGNTVHLPGNLSELSSSWFPLPLLVGCAVITALWWRVGRTAACWTALALVLALTFLACWALFPVPDWAGGALLSRSTPKRSPVALGLGSVLLMAVVGRHAPRRISYPAVWGPGVALTVWCTWWSARHLPWDIDLLSTGHILALALPTAIGFGAFAAGRAPRVAAAALAAYSVWSFGLVNPWYRGLGPLDRDPIVRQMQRIKQSDPAPLVVVFGDPLLASVARAAGVETLSGVTYYPDAAVMSGLFPGQQEAWNNYTNYQWVPLAKPGPAAVQRTRIDAATLFVHPCDPHLLALHPGWVLSDSPLPAAPCLGPGRAFVRGTSRLTLYRLTGSPGVTPVGSNTGP
ncbi:MAG TPA: hypothetical protein VGJ14_13460 [Sporichthyaceae bacterium]